MEQGSLRHWRLIGAASPSRRAAVRTVVVLSVLAGAGVGSGTAQTSMPDSQVEANVLRALAGLPGQSITTITVYGVVTLTGNVPDEAARTKAENLAANAAGVKKVVDELQLGPAVAAQGAAGADASGPGPGMVLQSDGTYAPAQGGDSSAMPAPGTAPAAGSVMNDPENDQAQYSQAPNSQASTGQGTGGQAGQGPAGAGQANQGGSPTSPQNAQQPPNGSAAYPPPNGYPQGNYPQGNHPENGYAQNGAQPWGGQVAGQQVAVPAGTTVRIRVNRMLASDRLQAGDRFDGVVANDVTAGGFVAIPRGASVQGIVVGAKSSGAISGRGELSLQLTSIAMGGHIYPVTSDVWARSGPDKTGHTVSNAAGLGLVGALIGGFTGGGAGALIGAGLGAGAGVATSAASPKGQVVVPPEGMLTFNLTQPTTVATLSEAEMQRLAYGVANGPPRRQPMYGRPYPGYYAPYPPPPPAYYPQD